MNINVKLNRILKKKVTWGIQWPKIDIILGKPFNSKWVFGRLMLMTSIRFWFLPGKSEHITPEQNFNGELHPPASLWPTKKMNIDLHITVIDNRGIEICHMEIGQRPKLKKNLMGESHYRMITAHLKRYKEILKGDCNSWSICNNFFLLNDYTWIPVNSCVKFWGIFWPQIWMISNFRIPRWSNFENIHMLSI